MSTVGTLLTSLLIVTVTGAAIDPGRTDVVTLGEVFTNNVMEAFAITVIMSLTK